MDDYTSELLLELERLRGLATKGEWRVKHYMRPEGRPEMLGVIGDGGHVLQVFWNTGLTDIDHANVALIAALQNAFPALREAIEQQQREITRLAAEVEKARAETTRWLESEPNRALRLERELRLKAEAKLATAERDALERAAQVCVNQAAIRYRGKSVGHATDAAIGMANQLAGEILALAAKPQEPKS